MGIKEAIEQKREQQAAEIAKVVAVKDQILTAVVEQNFTARKYTEPRKDGFDASLGVLVKRGQSSTAAHVFGLIRRELAEDKKLVDEFKAENALDSGVIKGDNLYWSPLEPEKGDSGIDIEALVGFKIEPEPVTNVVNAKRQERLAKRGQGSGQPASAGAYIPQ